MTTDVIRQNIGHMKNILKELYIFSNQINAINSFDSEKNVVVNTREKTLLNEAVSSLTSQLRILNNSIPELIESIRFFKRLETDATKAATIPNQETKLVQVRYSPIETGEKISLTISDKDKNEFLENLSKSNLSMNQLKKDFKLERTVPSFGKPNSFAKLSNKFFRDKSNKLVSEGYFNNLNLNLRKINSPFLVGTYVSMIFMTMTLMLIFSLFLFLVLLFFNISIIFPFITPATEPILYRFVQYVGLVFIIPLLSGVLLFLYPNSEAKNIGARIDQELPFVTIHMSSIATSGVEPLGIFKIILKSTEYRYTNREFLKLMNLINFHGKDIVTALKTCAKSSSSAKLRELFDGLATALTSGGDLHDFLDKHSETLLFDYKLEREKYTKASETFMDIYISIVIAAPMILMILFVIMGSTGLFGTVFGLPTEILSFLIILVIILLNIGFLVFLKMKQPTL